MCLDQTSAERIKDALTVAFEKGGGHELSEIGVRKRGEAGVSYCVKFQCAANLTEGQLNSVLSFAEQIHGETIDPADVVYTGSIAKRTQAALNLAA